ncbi:uncharacterized protein DSM5745_00770 [Aspergillus mulundensis]|uniref:Uncharacterized protein n=1 Tax=Aspergillus mulundensis TaxID=1810919 RepID=A0A3D8T606_9EURO|nr:hypothetical protein DSM5745_00770 [Aspergillus mulundensis]RDW93448.1 hypothetical protein DSM5745_00770 [Aspergillus mulundensis]
MMNKVGWHNCSGEKIKTEVLRNHKDWWAAVLPEGSDVRGPAELNHPLKQHRLRSTSATTFKDAGIVESIEDPAGESTSDDEFEPQSFLDCDFDPDSDYTPDSAPGSGCSSDLEGKCRETSGNEIPISRNTQDSVDNGFDGAEEKDIMIHNPEASKAHEPYNSEFEVQNWMKKRPHDDSLPDEISMSERRIKRPCHDWQAADVTDTSLAKAAVEGVKVQETRYPDSQHRRLTEAMRNALTHVNTCQDQTKSTARQESTHSPPDAAIQNTHMSVDNAPQPGATIYQTGNGSATSETGLQDNRLLGLSASQVKDISSQVRYSVTNTLEDYVFRITSSHKAIEEKLAAEVREKEALARTVKDCSQHIQNLQARLDFYTKRMVTQAQKVARLSKTLKDGGAGVQGHTDATEFDVA